VLKAGNAPLSLPAEHKTAAKRPTDQHKEESLAAQSPGLAVPGARELAENSAKTILQVLTELNVTTITFPTAEIATASGIKALPKPGPKSL
jgi:hypothetical protein